MARVECNRQAEEALQQIGHAVSVEDALHETASRAVRFFLSDFGQQIFRICVAESYRFPELGQRFYASGPALFSERIGRLLAPYVERGELKIEDMDLATKQFGELCKCDLFVRCLCGVECDKSEDAIERIANGAVETFLARYGA